jgi:DNA-binding MarR family transcriptional regulator
MATVTDPLASDLGRLLETLEDRTRDTPQPVLAHGLTALHTRILRELDRGLGTPTAAELAVDAGLVPDDVATAAAELRRDRLVHRIDASGGLELTVEGRAVVGDLERARRAGLRRYVDGLDVTARRRLEAALSLLAED